jgi:hypothetical protein
MSLLLSSAVLLQPYSLKVRFKVTSKKTDLDFEKRDVQLLVYVFDEASRVYEESVKTVVPQSVQQY